jgi:hypothetical protein
MTIALIFEYYINGARAGQDPLAGIELLGTVNHKESQVAEF